MPVLPTSPHPAGAMLMAAGRGERMRPLTDTCPKPLLKVRGLPLLQWHLRALAQGGVQSAAINTAWLGAQIEEVCGTSCEGVALQYSREGQDFGGALETAGGIARALPLLAPVFWLAAADVYAPDFVYAPEALRRFEAGSMLAHLWLVPNPPHNPQGDFGLENGLAKNSPKNGSQPLWTYSTMGLFRRELFNAIAPGNPDGVKAALAPLLRAAMEGQRVSAEIYRGAWTDVGTPERLAQLNAQTGLAE